MVYYLQQNVGILAQISQQIASIAPQVPIPSTPPPPFPDFHPLPSDIRVNVFWFMALVFSLSAALLATLVQQWVREYMHVFLRYSDPLKSARLRQYLHEGLEGWHMPVVAEAVLGLLHVSLFLFFAGLCDLVLNINTTIGVSTTIPIGISGLLYVFTTIAPVIYPQSPYKNSFSPLLWYLIQKSLGRRYQDRGSDGMKVAGHNTAQRQMQLAMRETEGRMGRDERAVRWLVDNMTEDAEMDLLVAAIPGSFNVEWGVEVWKRVSEVIQDENKNAVGNELAVRPPQDANIPIATPRVVVRPSRISVIRNPITPVIPLVRTRVASGSSPDSTSFLPPLPVTHSRDVRGHDVITHVQREHVRELSRRVAHLLETCKNRGLFASNELWRKRTRACVETTASLVFFADAELSWFGDIAKLLGEIGSVEKTRESSLTGMDQLFVTRWTCLSLTVIRPILVNNTRLQSFARIAVESFSRFEIDGGTDDQQAERSARKIDETFDRAWTCLWDLYYALFEEGNPTVEQAQEILRNHTAQISELELIDMDAGRMEDIDQGISSVQHRVHHYTHGIVRQLPGIEFDDFPLEHVPFSEALNLFIDPLKLQFIPLQSSLKGACSLYPRFRDILEGHDAAGFEETLRSLEAFATARHWQNNLLPRQLWRLQDLCDGGGLGFTVELFFLALKQLLSNSLSHESNSALFIGTFRAITSDWSNHKHSLGTQEILLAIAAPFNGIISKFDYPSYIIDEFLVLLGNILKGQTGPHIDNAVQELTELLSWHDNQEFWAKLLTVISQSQVPSL